MKENIILKAHDLILENINKDSIVVDATCGNGHDTLFLAERVKLVYAFDIQEEAIHQTQNRLKDFNNVKYILDSHENILNYVTDYDGVIFNLGYLPGSDKLIKTNHKTTIKTLENLNQNKKGFILLVIYPGHLEGFIESVAITSWLDKKNIKYRVIRNPYKTEKESPYIIFWNYNSF